MHAGSAAPAHSSPWPAMGLSTGLSLKHLCHTWPQPVQKVCIGGAVLDVLPWLSSLQPRRMSGVQV